MREANVTGNVKAPEPALAVPFPSITDPAQSTVTVRENVAISPVSNLAEPVNPANPEPVTREPLNP
jgi:hypothetical protein